MTAANTFVCLKNVKKIDSKSSHHKDYNNFFPFFFVIYKIMDIKLAIIIYCKSQVIFCIP